MYIGNGEEPQTWPLIRKVEVRGPWSVLRTGAIFVDLPGVRDANAARAKVAERYLQNCNHIAIVAPIKRAVDDGIAKELLGEQLKRRLLMNGQYGNIFFICTKCDDIESSETMRDHEDVARKKPGRWEKMTELENDLFVLEEEINELNEEAEDLQIVIKVSEREFETSKSNVKKATNKYSCSDSKRNSSGFLQKLKAIVKINKESLDTARDRLMKWEEKNNPILKACEEECERKQRMLKSICAEVRNEYSKACLQEDFRTGVEELYDDDGDESQIQTALPEDFNMNVFCISANDYLKVGRIKKTTDGKPNTFSNVADTQIPSLRSYIHEATKRFREAHTKSFIENTNDLVDRLKLLATNVADVPTGRSAYKTKSIYQSEMRVLKCKVEPIAENFRSAMNDEIQPTLLKSIEVGAQNGCDSALNTVQSWGSKKRRTANNPSSKNKTVRETLS
ncbi:hypothetical protein ACHAXS_001143 [Conticribra weissflogii]